MKKLIVLFILALPLGLGAQEVKIAVVNVSELYNVMPEVNAMESELAAVRRQYENEFKLLSDDYDRKMSDYMAQQDSLTENIRMLRMTEIENIRSRAENFQQFAYQEIQKKEQELSAPIQEKIINAIEQVGEENNYTYIINPVALLYTGKAVIDATEKVKAKLLEK